MSCAWAGARPWADPMRGVRCADTRLTLRRAGHTGRARAPGGISHEQPGRWRWPAIPNCGKTTLLQRADRREPARGQLAGRNRGTKAGGGLRFEGCEIGPFNWWTCRASIPCGPYAVEERVSPAIYRLQELRYDITTVRADAACLERSLYSPCSCLRLSGCGRPVVAADQSGGRGLKGGAAIPTRPSLSRALDMPVVADLRAHSAEGLKRAFADCWPPAAGRGRAPR